MRGRNRVDRVRRFDRPWYAGHAEARWLAGGSFGHFGIARFACAPTPPSALITKE
jgi:hypothetical protein